jgi:hypothetical protein
MVISVPAVIPVISQLLPPVLFGVPVELVGVPELTENATEYVSRSPEQAGEPIRVMVGRGVTVTVAVPEVVPEQLASLTAVTV